MIKPRTWLPKFQPGVSSGVQEAFRAGVARGAGDCDERGGRMSQWVQHISGQGEKWEVEIGRCVDCWHHHHKASGKTFFLPKSEYVLCDPPERWVDVTVDCHWKCEDRLHHQTHGDSKPEIGPTVLVLQTLGYRLRKIAMNELSCQLHSWAFIVERKEP